MQGAVHGRHSACGFVMDLRANWSCLDVDPGDPIVSHIVVQDRAAPWRVEPPCHPTTAGRLTMGLLLTEPMVSSVM
jgi:hypothetical protein